MDDVNARLATLVGSRICHDLINPIGAIANGIELLGLSGQMRGPEFDLITSSALNAGARIRFFRIAYGAAGEQMLGRQEIVSVLNDISQANRVKMHWTPPGPQARSDVRLAFLALQCCETAMPFGGSVQVGEDGGEWSVTGTADKMSLNPSLWELLDLQATGDIDIAPATLQFALLPRIAQEAGRTLRHEAGEGQVTIRF
ncbi:histidine phosphotransferase family protein [Seohaeicola zhoushanensis]|uniref:Histidine phosphotransferase n=1 Tax=Seohaeicola zhoushanensis TaxID=1569283 RepID=A0A8J3GYM7_9RHOB|nr:histidine phosphotransferase family protein [Seohaeicola zhoushanensis]GHF58737.1 histidine phosphotransferase [Seohaeicola zhoushanensis]